MSEIPPSLKRRARPNVRKILREGKLDRKALKKNFGAIVNSLRNGRSSRAKLLECWSFKVSDWRNFKQDTIGVDKEFNFKPMRVGGRVPIIVSRGEDEISDKFFSEFIRGKEKRVFSKDRFSRERGNSFNSIYAFETWSWYPKIPGLLRRLSILMHI